MRFSGTINAKIDAKGRVFFPSDFRKHLSDDDKPCVLKKDIYQPCLVIYPRSVWEQEVCTLRLRLNRWNPEHAMLLRQFLGDAETIELDAYGRFLIPRRFVQQCGIESGVSFVGVDDRIELWSTARTATPFLSPEAYAESMAKIMGAAPELPQA